MASGNSILTYLADLVSGRRFSFRLDRNRQAVWEAIAGAPGTTARASFGDARIDLDTGTIYVLTKTASGAAAWVPLATSSQIPIDPDGFAEVDALFTGVGGPNAAVDTSVLRTTGIPVVSGSGITMLQNEDNGTVLGLTEPGLYQIETNSAIFAGAGTTVDFGITKNTDAAGLTADPTNAMVGIQKFFQSVTLANEREGFGFDAVVSVSKDEAAVVNPAPLPKGALVRVHATNGSGGVGGGVRPNEYRMRATQIALFAA